jgi:hypothetical protein
MFGLDNKTLFPHLNTTFARRNDGSWSHEYESQAEDGRRRTVLEFVDVERLVTVHSEPVTQSIMTRHLSLAALPSELEAGFHACDGTELAADAEHKTKLGYDLVRVSSRDSSGAETKWVAPALDCYPIDMTATAPDGRRHTSMVTEVQLGPPSADRFIAPSGFAERSPTDIHQMYREKIPGAEHFPGRTLRLFQDRYDSGQRLHAQ